MKPAIVHTSSGMLAPDGDPWTGQLSRLAMSAARNGSVATASHLLAHGRAADHSSEVSAASPLRLSGATSDWQLDEDLEQCRRLIAGYRRLWPGTLPDSA